DVLDAGLLGYIGLYGDKTKVTDSSTGKPLVARHYALKRFSKKVQVDVFGATGHMGAIRERDGAITKTAHLVRSLVFSREKLEKLSGKMRLALADAKPHNLKCTALVLEGGQGFVPTHSIE